jgi:dienelactone hydrolase
LSERAAAAGVPTLRFDYDGSGDSAGDDRDPERVRAWIESVQHAVDELKRATGVASVYVLGVRLGAALAALAVKDRGDVAGYIAVAPVVSGKHYMRELRALQMALSLHEPPAGWSAPDGEREAAGFVLTSETQAALSELDLAKSSVVPSRRILLLDREELPSAEGWAAALDVAGANPSYRRVAGFAELVLDAHRARAPESIVQPCIEFITSGAAEAIPVLANSELASGAAPSSMEFLLGGRLVRETAAFMAGTPSLFGITSEPASAARSGTAIMLLNSGAIHHIGPNRLYVWLARKWASEGHLVARVDLSGLGDSAPRPGEPDNVVYGPRAVEDVKAAVAFLRAQRDVTKVKVVGLCSGGYHAFKAAVAGCAVDGVVAINPLTFFWKEGMSLDAPQQHDTVQDAQRYARMVQRWDAWKRVLSGRVDLRHAASVVLKQAGIFAESYAREVGRVIGRPLPDDLAVELDAVAKRGVDLQFLFASRDPGVELLRSQGGRAVRRLESSGKLGRHYVHGANHTFTATWMQQQFIAKLLAIVTDLRA